MTIDTNRTPEVTSWESGDLGRDPRNAVDVTSAHGAAIDEALGMQLISIRLPKKLIEELKFIARAHGVGYQPLIRDLLQRFVRSETNAIIHASKVRRETEAQAVENEREALLESNGKGLQRVRAGGKSR